MNVFLKLVRHNSVQVILEEAERLSFGSFFNVAANGVVVLFVLNVFRIACTWSGRCCRCRLCSSPARCPRGSVPRPSSPGRRWRPRASVRTPRRKRTRGPRAGTFGVWSGVLGGGNGWFGLQG